MAEDTKSLVGAWWWWWCVWRGRGGIGYRGDGQGTSAPLNIFFLFSRFSWYVESLGEFLPVAAGLKS